MGTAVSSSGNMMPQFPIPPQQMQPGQQQQQQLNMQQQIHQQLPINQQQVMRVSSQSFRFRNFLTFIFQRFQHIYNFFQSLQ